MTEPQTSSAGGRQRQRAMVGIALVVVLVAAYVFAAVSFGRSIQGEFVPSDPPPGGAAVVLVPAQIHAESRSISGSLLVFPDESLVDWEGNLTEDLVVTLTPFVPDGILTLPAGQVPAPVSVTIPAAGVVQQYPFDSYAVQESVAVTSGADSAAGEVAAVLPITSSVHFQVPGWSYTEETAGPTVIRGSVQRAGSTKAIAILLLALMVGLAVIAVSAVNSATRGRMKLELPLASWLTVMLFALIPIRSFFPGGPPLGSWMDILVYFWVEMVVMVCVGLVSWAIIVRARDTADASGRT